MSVIIILILFSVLVAAGFLVAFIWAVHSGQYDDTDSPAVRMLLDEKNNSENKNQEESKPAIKKPEGKQDVKEQTDKYHAESDL